MRLSSCRRRQPSHAASHGGDEKCSQGAWQAVNYRAHPAWHEAARDLTDGVGVGRVLEMVGGDNARRSLNAWAPTAGCRSSAIWAA
jgi:NADPH:quinone reductase-like Zn-dependent oxidoreductase